MQYSESRGTAIGWAMRGYRLPYSSYSHEEVRDVIAHKRNNIAAVITCVDGLEEYLDSDLQQNLDADIVNDLYDEMAKFCSYGLLGIGYFGISFEDGMPKRVDSCGKNVGALYGSAYEKMTGEEYSKMDRLQSMLLDQRDNRRFLQYIKSLENHMLESMSTVFSERESDDPAIIKCLEFDALFSRIAVSIGRSSESGRAATRSLGSARGILAELSETLRPYRRFLEDDRVTNLKDYTMTDLKPVTPRRGRI